MANELRFPLARVIASGNQNERDHATLQYHHYELASGAFQIAIVLASATIITGMFALAWVSGLLTLGGIGMVALGLWWPHLLHLH